MNEVNKIALESRPRRAWKTPAITAVGSVAEVLGAGNGKVSVITGDPGESQKVPAHEM
jgi:hypothetical protein